MMHALYVFGWDHASDALSLQYYGWMGGLYLVGAFLYSARIPERWFPGTFDLWLHSHQIFHVFVLLAALAHYMGVVNSYRWHHGADPFCLSQSLAVTVWHN
jgi:adiponectin receptor